MDLISQLGELALASRLKRLSDRLMREVSRVYKEQSLDFEARLFPVLFYLRMEGPSNITTIARGLNLTHPAVTQVAQAMTRRKLVKSQRVAGDERQRELVLTEKGLTLVKDLQPVWDEVAAATRELLEETKVDLVKHLERLEAALDERDMFQRVVDRLISREMASLEIVPHGPKFKKQLAELNREWSPRQFTFDADEGAAPDEPVSRVIMRGGMVFLARLGNRIAGTVAIAPITDSNDFELTLLAVSGTYKDYGIARKLAQRALEYAAGRGAARVVLAMKPDCAPAEEVFRVLGFAEDVVNPTGDRKTRKAITMILDLETANTTL